MKFTTTLSSANFALNVGIDYGSEGLSKLFPGMSVATAQKIIDAGKGRLTFLSNATISVPDDLCEGDDGTDDDQRNDKGA